MRLTFLPASLGVFLLAAPARPQTPPVALAGKICEVNFVETAGQNVTFTFLQDYHDEGCPTDKVDKVWKCTGVQRTDMENGGWHETKLRGILWFVKIVGTQIKDGQISVQTVTKKNNRGQDVAVAPTSIKNKDGQAAEVKCDIQ